MTREPLPPVLELAGASIGYERAIVTGATLSVASGSVCGLIGPNGAGKTTIVRAVAGGSRLFAGSVRVAGRDVAAYRRIELARLVGVLPQEVPAAFAFTCRAFVELGRHAYVSRFGGLTASDHAAVRRALELTDTAHLADMRVDTLSGGDLQRLTLAQALAQEPRLLVLDEPTSHLDLNHRLQVLDTVRSLADEGLAVLAVFHDLDMAARYADRLAVVAGGTLSPAAPPAEVLTEGTLADVFGVRAVIGADPVTGSVQVLPVLRVDDAGPSRGVRVLLVSGSGSGAAVMRRLVLDGFDVTCAALAEGDTDQRVAHALGVPYVPAPPYAAPGPDEVAAVRAAAEAADAIVVAATPFGPANMDNLRAVAPHAARVVLAGAFSDAMDFARGEATALLAQLRAAGARSCPDPRDVAGCIEEVMR